MDINLIVIAGKLAAEPELKEYESGTHLLRILVTVHSDEPHRRIDILPIVMWDPDDELVEEMTLSGSVRGRSIWVIGAVQRRFWAKSQGRVSKVEIVAHDMKLK